jgi:hypothetical protein
MNSSSVRSMCGSLVIGGLFALGAAACGDKTTSASSSSTASAPSSSGGGKVASCNMPSLKNCREYSGGNLALGTDSLKSLCTGVDKTAEFKDVACPTDALIAVCDKKEGKDLFYKDYPIALDGIEKDCKAAGGTFTKK